MLGISSAIESLCFTNLGGWEAVWTGGYYTSLAYTQPGPFSSCRRLLNRSRDCYPYQTPLLGGEPFLVVNFLKDADFISYLSPRMFQIWPAADS